MGWQPSRPAQPRQDSDNAPQQLDAGAPRAAMNIWTATKAAAGTLAVNYLFSRGLTIRRRRDCVFIPD